MKINFEDGSYLEVSLSANDKIMVSIGAVDPDNKLNITINSAEVSKEEWKQLCQVLET